MAEGHLDLNQIKDELILMAIADIAEKQQEEIQ